MTYTYTIKIIKHLKSNALKIYNRYRGPKEGHYGNKDSFVLFFAPLPNHLGVSKFYMYIISVKFILFISFVTFNFL